MTSKVRREPNINDKYSGSSGFSIAVIKGAYVHHITLVHYLCTCVHFMAWHLQCIANASDGNNLRIRIRIDKISDMIWNAPKSAAMLSRCGPVLRKCQIDFTLQYWHCLLCQVPYMGMHCRLYVSLYRSRHVQNRAHHQLLDTEATPDLSRWSINQSTSQRSYTHVVNVHRGSRSHLRT